MTMDKTRRLCDEENMSPEGKVIGMMMIPDGLCLQEPRPATPDNPSVQRGVIARLSMGWFGGLMTRKSQERTKAVYDYRVHLEADQSVRSMKLPSATYSTDSAAVGAWVLLELNDAEKTRGYSRREGRTASWEIQKKGRERPPVSSGGGGLRPSVGNVDRVY